MAPRDEAKVLCRKCAERENARKRGYRAQKACKAKEQSRIIIESTNSQHGDTNAESTEVPNQDRHQSQSSQSQASRQSEGRTEGQSQGQLGYHPNVLGLHPERPQRAHLSEALATVAVFATTFGLLIAGMLR
jgi:hypothetical protein